MPIDAHLTRVSWRIKWWKRESGISFFLLRFNELRESFPRNRSRDFVEMDSRFRGNDDLKKMVGACGSTTPTVNLLYTPF